MSESIGLEVSFFLASVFSGIAVLFFYDILRIFRRLVKHGKVSVAAEDILFWIGTSIFIFYMMYRKNNGIIRGFSIMGMSFGMLLYNQALSSYIVKGITFILTKIFHILFTPFTFLMCRLKKFFSFLKKKYEKPLKKRKEAGKIETERKK